MLRQLGATATASHSSPSSQIIKTGSKQGNTGRRSLQAAESSAIASLTRDPQKQLTETATGQQGTHSKRPSVGMPSRSATDSHTAGHTHHYVSNTYDMSWIVSWCACKAVRVFSIHTQVQVRPVLPCFPDEIAHLPAVAFCQTTGGAQKKAAHCNVG